MIANPVLPFIANPVTQGEVRTQTPVILEEKTGVKQKHTRCRGADRYLVLRCLARGIVLERCIRIVSVEARRRAVGVAHCAQPATKANRVCPERR